MIRFNEFANEPISLEGDKITLDSIVNKEVEFVQFRINKSKYSKDTSGLCLMLQVRVNDELRVIFTGSDVLARQMKQYGDHLPFLATIKKINRYYTFS